MQNEKGRKICSNFFKTFYQVYEQVRVHYKQKLST